MKLILTGATGFIGSEVLTQSLANSLITSIVALSRKPIEVSHPKLSVVLIEDFVDGYTPAVLGALEGAGGCIWTIGAKAITDPEITQRVTVDYAMAAARAFATLNRNGDGAKNEFRFVFTSGRMSEADRGKNLWLWKEARYVSGSAETHLLDLASETENFEAYVVKPAMVLGEENSVGTVLMSCLPSVRRRVLVAGMIEIALHGIEGGKRVLDNGELVAFGEGVLARRK